MAEEESPRSDSRWLKSIELRLLRCTISSSQSPSPLSPSNSLRSLVESILNSIERGNYSHALSLSFKSNFSLFNSLDSFEIQDTVESAGEFYASIERGAEHFLKDSRDNEAWLEALGLQENVDQDVDMEGRFALVLCVSVAALLAFVQQNVTGPMVKEFSPFMLPAKGAKVGCDGGKWDEWARNQLLVSTGSDLLGKISLLQYAVFADILLRKTREMLQEWRNCWSSGSKSISWWLCRIVFLHQRILEELSSSLYDILQVFKNETLSVFGEPETVINYFGTLVTKEEASTIASLVQLESGIIEYKYGRVDSSRVHLTNAEVACGLNLSVTGALGFRTMHQVEAKAQMVLVASTAQENRQETLVEFRDASKDNSISEDKTLQHSNGHYDSCDVLIRPQLVENGKSFDVDNSLSASQQAVILAQCLHLKRSSREDELSRWDIAPT